MPAAELITIGTELLLGDILDTNSRFLARALRDAGVDLYRTTTVGDNVRRIALAVQESLTRADIVITTGGLGPTVDDPTRLAVAEALQVDLVFHPELWEQIKARFRRYNRDPGENNKRQAYLPANAIPVENPVGTAPAFICEVNGKAIIALPGVPREMEHLYQSEVLPYLRRRFDLQSVIKTRVLHTAAVGESVIDELVGDLEELNNPTVGLLAHPGQIDIRIGAKAASAAEAEEMIESVSQEIHRRLGDMIYGSDDQTLESTVLEGAARLGWSISLIEAGLDGILVKRFSQVNNERFAGGEILSGNYAKELIQAQAAAFGASHRAEVALGVGLFPNGEKQEMYLFLSTPAAAVEISRSYGGPPQNAPLWAAHNSLDLVRREIMKMG